MYVGNLRTPLCLGGIMIKKQQESFGIESGKTLEQEFKWFLDGKSMYGPYWDHVLEYLKVSVERPERVFF